MSDSNGLRHGVIVLAAGASKRLGQPKQLLQVDGETLVHRAVRFSLETKPVECIVIGGDNVDQIAQAVSNLACRCLPCPDSGLGMSASLRFGLEAVHPLCDGALIVLTDQPALDAKHLCALRDRWVNAPTHAVASGYAGTVGVPALLPRTWFAAIQSQQGDQGARDILRARHDEVEVVDAPQLARDIDKPEDFAQLNSRRDAP